MTPEWADQLTLKVPDPEAMPLFTWPSWPHYTGRVIVEECGLCNGWGSHEYGSCQRCDGTGRWARPADACDAPDCERQGVPGNENVVAGVTVCDYCHYRHLIGQLPEHVLRGRALLGEEATK